MAHARWIALAFGIVVGACDDAGDPLRDKNPFDPAQSGDGGANDGSRLDGPPIEERLFRALEPQLTKTCGGGSGGTCHVNGTYPGNPAKFLAGPDAYKSIKGTPGIVVRDPFQSTLTGRGAHAGPALDADQELDKKAREWLEAEAVAIRAVKLPTTDPIVIVVGPNDIDLAKASAPGLSGVHLKFDASLVGGILSLTKIRIATAPGTAVHVLKPRFVKIVGSGKDLVETIDPADSFSNADQVVAGGAETTLQPGSALFAGGGFSPFDVAQHKVRVELEKLEPGTLTVIEPPKVCANANGFGTAVLPGLRATNAARGTCVSCHADGVAGLSLGSNDNTLVCTQVLLKLDKANIPQSRIIRKVTADAATHTGGAVVDPAAFTALFVNNAAVF
jgi:hypothetical protein